MMQQLKTLLSKHDLISVLEIVHAGALCNAYGDFLDIVKRAQSLIGFEKIFSCIGTDIHSVEFLNIDFPQPFLDRYVKQGLVLQDPVGQKFLETLDIQHWGTVSKMPLSKNGKTVFRMGRSFGLYDGYTYGTLFPSTRSLVTLSVGAGKIEVNPRVRALLKFVVPIFATTLNRLKRGEVAVREYHLTPRELEVMRWLKEGKSSWDIAMILHRSESSVNFHVKNIVQKLGAMNRTHAVAIAMQYRIV